MPLSSILFLFLTHLGAGIVFTLLLVSREVGVKFFRFNAGLALVLLVIGAAFRPAREAGWTDAHGVSLLALAACIATLGAYWLIVGRVLAAARPWLLGAAALGGGVMLLAQSLAAASPVGIWPVVTAASFVSSAALLGGSCTAMVLGHWYLVLPSMDVGHLQSMVKFHIGSLVVRVAVVGVATLLALGAWHPVAGVDFSGYIRSVEGIFYWQRVLFGLAGPGLLAWLTWETAKIRSTQSATGILYVDFFTVIVGEILAKYLLLATLVPV